MNLLDMKSKLIKSAIKCLGFFPHAALDRLIPIHIPFFFWNAVYDK